MSVIRSSGITVVSSWLQDAVAHRRARRRYGCRRIQIMNRQAPPVAPRRSTDTVAMRTARAPRAGAVPTYERVGGCAHTNRKALLRRGGTAPPTLDEPRRQALRVVVAQEGLQRRAVGVDAVRTRSRRPSSRAPRRRCSSTNGSVTLVAEVSSRLPSPVPSTAGRPSAPPPATRGALHQRAADAVRCMIGKMPVRLK